MFQTTNQFGNHGFYQFIRGVSLENPRDHKPRWDSPATIDDTGKKGMLRNIFSISIINIIRYIYREHQGYMIYIYIIPIYDEYYTIYWEQNRQLGS